MKNNQIPLLGQNFFSLLNRKVSISADQPPHLLSGMHGDTCPHPPAHCWLMMLVQVL